MFQRTGVRQHLVGNFVLFHTFQPITIQRSSQHIGQAKLSLAELISEGQTFRVVLKCQKETKWSQLKRKAFHVGSYNVV